MRPLTEPPNSSRSARERHVADVVRLLANGDARPRLRMQGNSMAPLLNAGMVIELATFDRNEARRGDIVVFRDGDRLVAHRIVGFTHDGLRTCGDAQPWSSEVARTSNVLGRVAAVYADESPGAERVDGPGFARLGRRYAASRHARAAAARMRFAARRAIDALPVNRATLFDPLTEALGGYVRGDGAAVARAVAGLDPERLEAFAHRHGCCSLLLRALALAPPSDEVRELASRLHDATRAAGVRLFAMRRQISDVATTLAEAGVEFALLKGAARIYADRPDAVLHPSHDIDVLVPRDGLNDAIAVMLLRGYRFRGSESERAGWLDHHHAAPLFPPKNGGWSVELHTQLAPSAALATPADWEALAPHMTAAGGPAGDVCVLDAFATTLHHAFHGVGLERLRDAVVCAQGLLALDDAQRAELRRMAQAERLDPVRLQAVLVLAARMAGLPWPQDPQTSAYLAWVAKREEMPLSLGSRSQAIEAWYAAGGRFGGIRANVLRAGNATLLRTVARVLVAPVVSTYSTMLRR